MVDWKYGVYHLLWWAGLIISISFVDYLVKASWGVSTILVLAVILVFAGILSIFERKHPYFHEKNRQTTIKYFRLFSSAIVTILFVLYFLFFDYPFDHLLILLWFVAFSDIIPSFFTELV